MTDPTIDRVETVCLEAPLEEPFGYAQEWVDRRTATLVRIETVDGTVGWGECWGPIAGTREAVTDFFAPRLEGNSVQAVNGTYDALYDAARAAYQSIVPLPALSGIDIALWDLWGNYLGESVASLLGGRRRERVDAYATGHYFKPVDSLDEQFSRISAEAETNFEALGAVKLKLGLAIAGYGPEADIELVDRVRKRLGDAATIMVDANYAYDRPTAEEVGRQLADRDIRWFEEPVRPEDIEGYATLCEILSVPVAGGECHTSAEVRRLLEIGGLDIVQPDVCNFGGLTPAHRIAEHLAGDHRAQLIPHVWGTPVALGASLQLIASLPTETMLEFDRSPNPLREEIAEQPITADRDGCVAIPDCPGIGVDLDESAIERYRIA